MCGIVGFATTQPSFQDRVPTLRKMCDAIYHRGPDDQGQWHDEWVALGMRRLSVIDVAGGDQPQSNERGDVHVVFNGEIYNHKELQQSLQTQGHIFTTRSDTEVLVHLWEERGPDMVHDLVGMFAFALWDASQHRLFIARDRLGIKPLYYRVTGEGVWFASELRSMLTALPQTPDLDRASIGAYLTFGYVPGPRAVFEGMRKLQPGHTLEWQPSSGVAIRQYWRPARAPLRDITVPEAVSTLRSLLDQAVQCHLESDVPLGAFLSGGIDSSIVVGAMARAMSLPVETFSIGFVESDFNEAPVAAMVANAFGTTHRQRVLRPDVDTVIDDIVACFDEPFADSSALPTMMVAQLARRHVTVALSGDGGDELFLGYTRYTRAARQHVVPAPFRALLGAAYRALPHGALGRNRLLDLSRSQIGRYAMQVAIPLTAAEGGIARNDIAVHGADFDELLAGPFGEAIAAGAGPLTALSLVDIATYLPDDILTKVDRTTMAVSLEARVPLLDHRLVEFALTLPDSLKYRDGQGKWLLRQTFGDLVPPVVFSQRKHGFSVPLGTWLRRELRPRLDELTDGTSPTMAYVDPGSLNRVVGEHLRGRRDHSHLLWRVLVLHIWLQALSDDRMTQPSRFSATVCAGS